MKLSTRVHWDGWRLVYHQYLIIFENNLEREVENWRFFPDSFVGDYIIVF